MNSGSSSRIRTVAASSVLDRAGKLILRQTARGYEVYANGDASPTRCATWPQARRVLFGLGISHQRLDEISARLVEGKGLVIRRGA
jgi:hypothetical protein